MRYCHFALLFAIANAWIPNEIILQIAGGLTFNGLIKFNMTHKNAFTILKPIFDLGHSCVLRNNKDVWPVLVLHESLNHKLPTSLKCLKYLEKWSFLFSNVVLHSNRLANSSFVADAILHLDPSVSVKVGWNALYHNQVNIVLKAIRGTSRKMTLIFQSSDWDTTMTNLIAHHLAQSNIVKLDIIDPIFKLTEPWIFNPIFDAIPSSRLSTFYLKRNGFTSYPYIPVSGKSLLNGLKNSHLLHLEIESCICEGVTIAELFDSLPSSLLTLRVEASEGSPGSRYAPDTVSSSNMRAVIHRIDTIDSIIAPPAYVKGLSLIRLNLIHLDQKGIKAGLVLFLRNLHSLEHLSISKSELDGTTIDVISGALPYSIITNLKISCYNAFVLQRSLSLFSNAIAFTRTLKVLDLSSSHISQREATSLAQAISLSELTNFDICDNNLLDAGAIVFASSLASSKLIKLNVARNKIRKNGADALQQAVAGLDRFVDLVMTDNPIMMLADGNQGFNCFGCSVS